MTQMKAAVLTERELEEYLMLQRICDHDYGHAGFCKICRHERSGSIETKGE